MSHAAGRQVPTPTANLVEATLWRTPADPLGQYAGYARVTDSQGLLFALKPSELCMHLGLAPADAQTLHEAGLLSFSPLAQIRLDESQEAELKFVGSLLVSGCDLQMVRRLTASLEKPYAYDLRRIYFDWQSSSWRLLPDSQAEAAFTEWLEGLITSKDEGTLKGIIELATEALCRIRSQ